MSAATHASSTTVGVPIAASGRKTQKVSERHVEEVPAPRLQDVHAVGAVVQRVRTPKPREAMGGTVPRVLESVDDEDADEIWSAIGQSAGQSASPKRPPAEPSSIAIAPATSAVPTWFPNP